MERADNLYAKPGFATTSLYPHVAAEWIRGQARRRKRISVAGLEQAYREGVADDPAGQGNGWRVEAGLSHGRADRYPGLFAWALWEWNVHTAARSADGPIARRVYAELVRDVLATEPGALFESAYVQVQSPSRGGRIVLQRWHSVGETLLVMSAEMERRRVVPTGTHQRLRRDLDSVCPDWRERLTGLWCERAPRVVLGPPAYDGSGESWPSVLNAVVGEVAALSPDNAADLVQGTLSNRTPVHEGPWVELVEKVCASGLGLEAWVTDLWDDHNDTPATLRLADRLRAGDVPGATTEAIVRHWRHRLLAATLKPTQAPPVSTPTPTL